MASNEVFSSFNHTSQLHIPLRLLEKKKNRHEEEEEDEARSHNTEWRLAGCQALRVGLCTQRLSKNNHPSEISHAKKRSRGGWR